LHLATQYAAHIHQHAPKNNKLLKGSSSSSSSNKHQQASAKISKQQRHCCAHLQRLLWSKTAAKSTPNRSSLPGVVTSSIQVAGFKSSGIGSTPGIASK